MTFQLVKTYKFDGTKEGVKLLNDRLYSKDKYKAYYVNGEIRLKDGLFLRKDDYYQVLLPETFQAIG